MLSKRKCPSKIFLPKLTGNQLASSVREEFYLGCTEYTMKAALEVVSEKFTEK